MHSVSKYIHIHNLDDDSLLNIFNLCRPNVIGEDEYGVVIQWSNWAQERWWYQLVKVCRRWRYLILGSASHLGLCLVCTRGTPVADMLTHSPPLPLIIDHDDEHHDLTAEDEEGIMFALQHRDRVRCIDLVIPGPSLQKVIQAVDGPFPMLECLHFAPPTKYDGLVLPSTFEAPRLRMIVLYHFASPIGSPLLTTAVSLVCLTLRWIHSSIDVYPNHLFQALSRLPQLQNFTIIFSSPIPNREIERQLLRMPIITHITFPNLLFISIRGVSAYLEALLSHMNAPLLNKLEVTLFNQLSFSVPHLRQFMTTTEIIRSSTVEFFFYHKEVVMLMFYPSSQLITLCIRVGCHHLDWQVSSVTQISNVLGPLSPPWWISPLTIGAIHYRQSGTIKLTAPSGANFSDHSGMWRPFGFTMASLGSSLVV